MAQLDLGTVQDNHRGSVPRTGLTIAAVILSAFLSWFWFLPGLSGQLSRKADVTPHASMLDQVSEADMPNALRTMNGSPDFFAQFKARKDVCREPLAWVSLARTPGGPPTRVRIRTSGYVSPEFELSDVLLRVAIPFPGPYEAGRGTLEVMSVGGGGTVALRPASPIVSGSAKTIKQVTWKPIQHCSKPNE
jgi:hypothetical protein